MGTPWFDDNFKEDPVILCHAMYKTQGDKKPFFNPNKRDEEIFLFIKIILMRLIGLVVNVMRNL